MYKFIFTKSWEKEFLKLWSQDKDRVINKLKILTSNSNLNHNFKLLTDMLPATHRLRIWNIRVILEKIDDTTFHILDIWYRWNIYK